MGVISFGEDGVWGAAGAVIYALITYCIKIDGDQEYLQHFQRQFDYGYNSIHLSDIKPYEVEHFRNLVTMYIESEQYVVDLQAYDYPEMQALLSDLRDKLTAYSSRRSAH